MSLGVGWKRLGSAQWRYCAKVALAAALGFLLTLGGERQYAIYSAFAAALVVGSTLGEDLTASANRVKGTLAGMLAGMGISLLFGPSLLTVGLAVALTALLALGFGWGVPAARIGITLCIITLVTHRADALEYNSLRALNTVIGVMVGLAVSLFVWPVRAHHAMQRAERAALDAAGRLLDALAAGQAGLRPAQTALYEAVEGLVKAAREGNVERKVLKAHQHDPRAMPILQFGLDVLAAALAAEAGATGPRASVDDLRRRLEELRAA